MSEILRFLSGAAFGGALIVGAFVGVTTDWENIEQLAEARGLNTAQPAFAANAAPSADPVVAAARLRARDTLRGFAEMAAVEGHRRIGVQVELPAANGGVEYVWMKDCASGGPIDFVCVVEEEPSRAEVKVGDAYAVDSRDIADWIVVDANGVIHGAFSLRAQLPTMPTADRADLISQLAPLPRR
ncbi:MAG: DUF2314 domain-containing protein [Pseudomonadota bacterium]